MNTEQEIIEVVTHHMNGGDVECRTAGTDNEWFPFLVNPVWNFYDTEYRKKPEAAKRLLTVKEIWGKTLIGKTGNCFLITTACMHRVEPEIHIMFYNEWKTVEYLHQEGWRLAGPDLNYETATSLEVDA